MNILNWMWNFRKNSLKNFVNTRFPELLILSVLFLYSCAQQVHVAPTKQPLVDPLRNTELPSIAAYQTGYQEYLRGNQQKARQSLMQVAQEHPDYYPAHLALAYSFLADNKQADAEDQMRKALEIHADYPQAH